MNVSPFFYCIVFTYNPFLQNQYFTQSIFYRLNYSIYFFYYLNFMLFFSMNDYDKLSYF